MCTVVTGVRRVLDDGGGESGRAAGGSGAVRVRKTAFNDDNKIIISYYNL